MGDKLVMDVSALEEAEVFKAFLATVCRSKACSQISKHIIMVWKVEGQPGVGQQQAWYYLESLNISQCMGLDRIHFKGAGIH